MSGRAEVENQYIRAVTPSGNATAQADVARVFEIARRRSSGAVSGFLPKSALRLRDEICASSTPNGASAVESGPAEDNPACECGAILRGAEAAARMQAVRHGLHARDADGLVHGVARGRLRRALDLWPVPRAARRAGRPRGRRVERMRQAGTAASWIFGHGRVDLSPRRRRARHGRLIEDIFLSAFDNDWLRAGNDQAAFDVAAGRMVMTTDAYVVSPMFFPGGDIGALAVNGTINDIAMAGARPLYLSASFVIEEGFPLADLLRVADEHGRGLARPRACRSSPATRKSSNAARRTGSSFRPRASASRRRGSSFRAIACVRAMS